MTAALSGADVVFTVGINKNALMRRIGRFRPPHVVRVVVAYYLTVPNVGSAAPESYPYSWHHSALAWKQLPAPSGLSSHARVFPS